MQSTTCLARAIAFSIILSAATAAFADDRVWSVSKSSGEVWVTTPGAQQASLTQNAGLKPGDAIRTGRNGRVLLVRGDESILVSPNSAIGIPAEARDGLATTIVQQAGSILLEVEKRNVQHFEVETPYLAAVVKGTKFSVTVNATGTSVNVTRGQVQVADFKSGQIAQIMPGQFATSFAQGRGGLSLSGAGSFAPIEQGTPRAPSIDRLMVPKNGLSAPRNAATQQVQPVGQIRAAAVAPAPGILQPARGAATARPAPTGLRISSAIGDVKLNFQKVTNGVARSVASATPGRAAASRETTIWNGRDGKGPAAAASVAGNGSENSKTAAAIAASSASGLAAANSVPSPATSVATDSAGNAASGNAVANAASAASGNAGSNSGATGNGRSNSASGNSGNSGNSNRGNGNSGNGNGNSGNGNGNNGNGNGNGNNGNGNGGVGNGNGNGNTRH